MTNRSLNSSLLSSPYFNQGKPKFFILVAVIHYTCYFIFYLCFLFFTFYFIFMTCFLFFIFSKLSFVFYFFGSCFLFLTIYLIILVFFKFYFVLYFLLFCSNDYIYELKHVKDTLIVDIKWCRRQKLKREYFHDYL